MHDIISYMPIYGMVYSSCSHACLGYKYVKSICMDVSGVASFKIGRAQSGPLTALIECLNILLEYFEFFLG